ncbi:hypothetical protein [Streptomyces scabiei]|uniref:hypothetical protein n=1 Tax=Streptomyces scabiei TaxID=1930 RepID=UPI0029AE3C81|nr:hypothetical protein [Streptomyces scabiei]MDX3520799.1 hypothetical protein [Streptomyces scabiei]
MIDVGLHLWMNEPCQESEDYLVMAAGEGLEARILDGTTWSPRSAPRTTLTAAPDRHDPLTPVKHAGPQLVPKNDQGPISDVSETGPDLRLSPVGTTGFEPATP